MGDLLQQVWVLMKFLNPITGDALTGRGDIDIFSIGSEPVFPSIGEVSHFTISLFTFPQRLIRQLALGDIPDADKIRRSVTENDLSPDAFHPNAPTRHRTQLVFRKKSHFTGLDRFEILCCFLKGIGVEIFNHIVTDELFRTLEFDDSCRRLVGEKDGPVPCEDEHGVVHIVNQGL